MLDRNVFIEQAAERLRQQTLPALVNDQVHAWNKDADLIFLAKGLRGNVEMADDRGVHGNEIDIGHMLE